MSALPAVQDETEAAELVREIFRTPSETALALATPEDRTTHDAVLRYLHVVLADVPPEQAALLRRGAARLLHNPELAGHLVGLLGETEDAAVASEAAAVVEGGDLRGLPVHGLDTGDLHALLLGLCARFGVAPGTGALVRDAQDQRYRDLALVLLAGHELDRLVAALPAALAGGDAADEYAVEAAGRAIETVIQRHGEAGLLRVFGAAPPEAGPLLLAALREALEPARLAYLTDAQRAATLAGLQRRAADEPNDEYLPLRLDPGRRAALLARAQNALEGTS